MKTIEELGISPAPWKKYVGVYSFWVDDNSGEFVCMKNSTSMNDRNIGKRNASLIAAAPDLYEALRECVGEMCKFCGETEIGKRLPCEMGCETMRRAKTALEKAGGAQ